MSERSSWPARLRELGLSEETTHELICDFQPDFDPDWVALPVESAYRHAQNAPGIDAGRPAAETFKDYAPAEPAEQPGPAEPARPSSKFTLLDEDEQDAEPDIDPLVGDDFLPDGGSAVIYAPFGSYKSFIAAELALAVASGKPAFGTLKVYRPGPVVYLLGEGHRGFAKRRRAAWRKDRNITGPLSIYTVKGVPLADNREEMDDCVQAIKARLNGERPALVIIDTVARSMLGLSENDTSDATRYVSMTDEMAERLQCLVLSIAHWGRTKPRRCAALPRSWATSRTSSR